MASALELDQQLKAQQAFYDAARAGKTIEEAHEAANAAAKKVYEDYVMQKVGVSPAPSSGGSDG